MVSKISNKKIKLIVPGGAGVSIKKSIRNFGYAKLYARIPEYFGGDNADKVTH